LPPHITHVEEDGEPFEEKIQRLTAELAAQFKRARELEEEIGKNLAGIGYGL
jgi:type I restriction enzyme M protein